MKTSTRFSDIEQGQTFTWKNKQFTKTGPRNAKQKNQEFIFSFNDCVEIPCAKIHISDIFSKGAHVQIKPSSKCYIEPSIMTKYISFD